jgi:alpha-L-rhamnosidase
VSFIGNPLSVQKLTLSAIAFLLQFLCGGFAVADIRPVDLRCEGLVDTPAVGVTPQLSWRLESHQRNQKAAFWQILVASRQESLSVKDADFWNSGKTIADRIPGVKYAGKPLLAGQKLYWKVRVWDSNGKVSSWSESASWRVAPLTPGDWLGAKWIDDGKSNPKRDQDLYKPDPAPLFRREFEMRKPVVAARLHIAGLGVCVPSINGIPVRGHEFAPQWTHFEKRTLFSSHDVTEQVKSGENCLAFALGNGWFNPLPLKMWSRRNIRGSLPTGRPRAIALLVVEHLDGTTTRVVTDTNWKTSAGSVLSNSVYLGEVRDARLQPQGWRRTGFDDAGWKPARIAQASLEVLRPRIAPPVIRQKPVDAVNVTSPSDGVHIVDFGQNLTGVAEIKLSVPAGTRIEFRYGELLNADGTLNPLTSVCGQIKGSRKNKAGEEVPVGGAGAPPIAWQQDVYIARGGGEVFRPEFTFHGFRYMEMKGLAEAPPLGECRAFPVRSNVQSAGSFECSNDRLNQIQQMCRRTFLANIVSVQSDCPHRERFAYGGDIVATSEAFMMNFDMSGFYAKTIRDWSDAAKPDGRFTDTAPFVGIDYCGVGWAMVHPWLLEQHYQHYGRKELLVREFPKAMRWLVGEAKRRKNGLVVRGLSDHEALSKSGGPAMTTPLFIYSAAQVGRLARIVGREQDAERCENWVNESMWAWEREFLDLETGVIGNGTQSMQAFALGFGAVQGQQRQQDRLRQRVFDRLVEQLMENDRPELTTGIFGTQCLLEQLSKNGRADLGYALANRNTFPSWGWMLENGATTLWEHWEGSDNTYSHNHPMFGSISAWFFRWLGGIQAAPDAIGFDRIEIRPQVVAGLDWVKCSHRSVRGDIESNWSNQNGTQIFSIVIPPDTQATIVLPQSGDGTIKESGMSLEQIDAIEVLPSPAGQHRLRVGSGHYNFTIE